MGGLHSQGGDRKWPREGSDGPRLHSKFMSVPLYSPAGISLPGYPTASHRLYNHHVGLLPPLLPTPHLPKQSSHLAVSISLWGNHPPPTLEELSTVPLQGLKVFA